MQAASAALAAPRGMDLEWGRFRKHLKTFKGFDSETRHEVETVLAELWDSLESLGQHANSANSEANSESS